MILAPDRVAGLILCGDLSDANRLAVEAGGVDVLDAFLHRILDCPFVIIWDGGAQSVVSGSSAHDAIESASSDSEGRCVILGGGTAPHRTKPEQFAWILTRFVEEKLDYHPRDHSHHARTTATADEPMSDEENDDRGVPTNTPPSSHTRQNNGTLLQNLNLPFGINSVVSPEGRLLLGRAVAAALFYMSLAKVVVVQYGNVRSGLISVKSSVDSVDALRRKVFQAIGAFIVNFGYLPRLFKFSAREVNEDEYTDGRKRVVVAPSPENAVESDQNKSLPNHDNGPGGGSSSDSQKGTVPERGDTIHREETDDLDGGDDEKSRFKPFFFLDNIIT
jgi:hypothetical protein